MSFEVAIIASLGAMLILVLSAERAVNEVLSLLKHFGLSATFGGLTVFSMMTSLPELISHLIASIGILRGTLDYKIASATVLGANIGSDVVQQTLVLGLVVLLAGGFTFKRTFLLTAYLPMIGTTLLTLFLAWDLNLSRLDGGILVGVFFGYLAFLYSREQSSPPSPIPSEDDFHPIRSGFNALLLFVFVLSSAHILLSALEVIVRETGVGGSLVGVVTLGLASAAPEMVTAIAGYRRGEVGLSLGTLIGSNITNPLVAIGGGALISTYHVPKPLVYWDLPMETGTAALLLAYLLIKKNRGYLGRMGGVYLVFLYLGYLAVRVTFFATDG